jgi:hypothetical protein
MNNLENKNEMKYDTRIWAKTKINYLQAASSLLLITRNYHSLVDQRRMTRICKD